jgi:hypothetical protein
MEEQVEVVEVAEVLDSISLVMIPNLALAAVDLE